MRSRESFTVFGEVAYAPVLCAAAMLVAGACRISVPLAERPDATNAPADVAADVSTMVDARADLPFDSVSFDAAIDSDGASLDADSDAMTSTDVSDASADAPLDVLDAGPPPTWRPRVSTTFRHLRSVSGTSAMDVWAVGEGGTAVHFDGTGWTLIPTGSTALLRAVFAIAPNDVWAAGWERFDSPVLLHWDGMSWTRDTSTTDPYLVQGIWGSASNDIWAVGGSGEVPNNVVLHWNGMAWARVDSEGRLTQYLGVSGTSARRAWMIGADGTLSTWDGMRWSMAADRIAFFSPTGGLWAAADDDVWITGARGQIYRYHAGTIAPRSLPTAEYLFGVHGIGPRDAWAVGSRGTVAHWDGAAWTLGSRPTLQRLWSVWMAAAGRAWAVGDSGTILELGP